MARWLSRSRVQFLLLLLVAMGCGEDSGSGPPPSNDTTPPAITSVTALDLIHVSIVFGEAVDKLSAEHAVNYTVVEESTPVARSTGGASNDAGQSSAPGDTLAVGTATLSSDQETVLVTLFEAMGANPYRVDVHNVEDLNGNKITTTQSSSFTGTINPDTTPPEIVARTPVPNAANVGVGESIVIQFSEPMDPNSVMSAFSLECAGSDVAVRFSGLDNAFMFTPVQSLGNGRACAARISSTARDVSGNSLTPAMTTWNFSTRTTADGTPPTLVSTTPSNGATNVSTDVVFRIRFSEAIDPASLEQSEGPGILVNPDPGDGLAEWSTDRTTLTFSPDVPLASNTFYALVVPQGAVRDLAGNLLSGSTIVQFTTGSMLPNGRISGNISGDSQSAEANDPTGAVVVATTNSPFSRTDDDVKIYGVGLVAANDSYTISRLPDAWYFPFCFMDSNADGILEPDRGDAFGAFGVDVGAMDFEIDSVRITGGGIVGNVGFPMYDPVAISGSVVYGGALYNGSAGSFQYFVGAFDTTTFDTTGGVFPDPDFGTFGYGLAWDPDYVIGSFGGSGLNSGTYWVSAYLDVNFNQQYDPDTDPANFFGIGGQAAPVTVENGLDGLDINIVLLDPAGAAPTLTSAWRKPDARVSPEQDALKALLAHAARVTAAINRQHAVDR